MKASAHGDVIIAMRDWPGPDSPTELALRFDHDHWHAPLGQPDSRRDTSNSAACDNDRFG
jgi:hypothetical protein